MGLILELAGQGTPANEAAGKMADAIKELVYQYSERVPVATAVGVLEIVKAEIMAEQK